MSYSDTIDALDIDDEDDLGLGRKARRDKNKKKERTVFSVYEIDTHKDNVPAYCAFESFGNPIPALRYAARLNARGGRHKYMVSPRPSATSIKAANV